MATLMGIIKIVLYTFPIGKTKDFGVGIIFECKNIFLKKRISEIGSFHGKAR